MLHPDIIPNSNKATPLVLITTVDAPGCRWAVNIITTLVTHLHLYMSTTLPGCVTTMIIKLSTSFQTFPDFAIVSNAFLFVATVLVPGSSDSSSTTIAFRYFSNCTTTGERRSSELTRSSIGHPLKNPQTHL